VVVILIAASAGLWSMAERGIGPFASDKDKEKDRDPTVELAAADVATVAAAVLSRSLPVTGSLSPLVQTTVKAQVPGEVLEVTVREGQTVREGDVLVRIDTRNLVAELANRQALLEKARADLALASLNREKSAAMLAKKFIAQNDYDAAESAYQAGVANVKAAEAQVSLARIALDFATVRAPFAGTISARLVQPGEKVETGTSLLGLVDLAHLELQAPAPADDVPSVHIGQVAQFTVGGFGARVFEGRVERINPMTDTGSRSVMLYLSVDNPDGVLKGGMFAQGKLILDRTEPVPAIPITAVRDQAGVQYVFTVENARLVRRPVKLGLRSVEQNLVEIREGLPLGAHVVAARIETLKEGAPVIMSTTPLPATAPATANR
jgi:RND family efflux transporter MFP subunit